MRQTSAGSVAEKGADVKTGEQGGIFAQRLEKVYSRDQKLLPGHTTTGESHAKYSRSVSSAP